MTDLYWVKSTKGEWLSLDRVNLDPVKTTGVYIIWHGGNNPQVVRIGQGDIASRLNEHRRNHQIKQYLNSGPLMVTWATVNNALALDGIERYLAELYSPVVGDRFPAVHKIAVNTPF